MTHQMAQEGALKPSALIRLGAKYVNGLVLLIASSTVIGGCTLLL